MTPTSLLNSKGKCSRAWSLVMSFVAYPIGCIAFVFITHVLSALSWNVLRRTTCYLITWRWKRDVFNWKISPLPPALWYIYIQSILTHKSNRQPKYQELLKSVENYSAQQHRAAGETSTGWMFRGASVIRGLVEQHVIGWHLAPMGMKPMCDTLNILKILWM